MRSWPLCSLSGRTAALCLPWGSVQWGPEESEAAMGAAKLLEMPVVLQESGQGRLSFAGLQSSRTEA